MRARVKDFLIDSLFMLLCTLIYFILVANQHYFFDVIFQCLLSVSY